MTPRKVKVAISNKISFQQMVLGFLFLDSFPGEGNTHVFIGEDFGSRYEKDSKQCRKRLVKTLIGSIFGEIPQYTSTLVIRSHIVAGDPSDVGGSSHTSAIFKSNAERLDRDLTFDPTNRIGSVRLNTDIIQY